MHALGVEERWRHPQGVTVGGMTGFHPVVNDGACQLLLWIWVILHIIVYPFGYTNYYLKHNLAIARATFGLGYRELLIERWRCNLD